MAPGLAGLAPVTWMAAAAWTGAFVGWPVPVAVGPLLVGLGYRTKAVFLVVLGLALLASSLSARSSDGLVPVSDTRFEGEATLASDPARFGPSVRVDLQIGNHRIEAWARGPEAARLSNRLMGERIWVAGRLKPPPGDAPWLVRRRITGRLSIDHVGGWWPGDPASRAANGLRRTLAAGAESMDRDTRSLYAGLLLGDQRDQGPVVADNFRGSGLTHLLAVSGQNVAFVLVLVGPALRRMRLTPRLMATIGVLAFFALVTRFEPSVLRATTMAGCAAVAVTVGREADSRRMLALAVLVLVLVDPLIARQLAFQLSVAATLGILLWSQSISVRLPGPRPLASAVAVTVSAQVAVAPLLIPTFGGMPVSALLANVLAAPMTGPVVVWGIPAGLVAGIVGGRTAELVHLPTAFMVQWIARVAEWCALLPLGEIRLPHLVVGAVAVAAGWLGRRVRSPAPVAVAALVLTAALVQPAIVLRTDSEPMSTFGDGTRLHVADGAVVLELDTGARPDVVLEQLRRRSITRIDVVVAVHGGRDVAEVVAELRRRSEPRLVLAPPGHRVPGGSVAVEGSVISAGALEVSVQSVADRLGVEVRLAPP